MGAVAVHTHTRTLAKLDWGGRRGALGGLKERGTGTYKSFVDFTLFNYRIFYNLFHNLLTQRFGFGPSLPLKCANFFLFPPHFPVLK